MPYVTTEQAPDYNTAAQAFGSGPTSQDQAQASAYNTGVHQGIGSGILGAAVGGVPDLIDTVASSVGLTNRGTVNNTILSAIGSPGLTGWFDANHGAAEVGSSLYGTIAADMIAKRILAPASAVMGVVRQIPYVKNIATLDAQYERAQMIAKVSTMEAANRGLTGVDRFIGENMATKILGVPVTLNRSMATKNFLAAGAAKTVARGLTTEAIMAAGLHTNSMLYDDSLSHNLAWGALAVGTGVMLESLIDTYALRKMAVSDPVRQANRQAFDVSGIEAGRVHSFDLGAQVVKQANGEPVDNSFLFKSGGPTTDLVTGLAVQAAENTKVRGITETARTLFGKREQIATPLLDQAHNEMQKVTVRGIRGVQNSGATMADEGIGAPIKESLSRDPMAMYGVEEIGAQVGNFTLADMHAMRSNSLRSTFTKVQSVLNDGGTWSRKTAKDGTFTDILKPLTPEAEAALRSQANNLHFSTSFVPMTMLEPGELAPLSHAELIDGWVPREATVSGGLGQSPDAIWEAKKINPTDSSLGIGADSTMYLPTGKARFEQLDPHDALNMFGIGRSFANHYISTGAQLVVPKNPHWFQLDLAEQIAANGNPSQVVYPGTMTRETAAVESFAQKVDAIRRREMAMSLARKRGGVEALSEADMFKTKVLFNLPRIDAYTAGLFRTSETPIDLLLHGIQSGDQVRGMSHQQILGEINSARTISGMTDETAPTVKNLSGNSFNFMMDRDGKPIKQMLFYKRPMNPLEWSRDDLLIRKVAKDAHVQDQLVGDSASPYIRELVGSIMADPASSEARNVMELADDQHRSFIPGFRDAAPQTSAGSFINSITQKDRRDVDSIPMLAASKIQEVASKIGGALTKDVFDNHMGPLITQLTSTRNARSKMLVDQFITHGQGWELKPELVTDKLGANNETIYKWVLDHESVQNQQMFEQAYGRKLEKGQALLNPQGQPVIADELARDFLEAAQGVHGVSIDAKNTLLRAQGLPEIRRKNWYMPPPATQNKYVMYTFDESNNVVPRLTIRADSPQSLAALKAETMTSPLWKDGYRIRSSDDAKAYMSLWDKAQMEFVQPNTTAIQPGKKNLGRSVGALMNPQATEEALVSMRDSLMGLKDDVMEVLFDDPIKAAKARAAIAKEQTAVGSRTQAQHSSIYDRYLQNLTGKSSLGAKDSFFGDAYKWAESRINGLLNLSQTEQRGVIGQVFSDVLRSGASVKGTKFDEFAQTLGQYMPYANAHEMAMRQAGSHTPREIADITKKLSWFEAADRLRWFESMHAVVNVASLIANTPSIIRSLQPKLGETLEEAGRRNSSLAMLMHLPETGEGIVIPNTAKLMWAGMKDRWSKEPAVQEFIRDATRNGMMRQEVAEMDRQWGAIDSKAGWRGVMFGDQAAEGTGLGGKVARAGGIDKWLSILSDGSEDLTRQWGMLIGRRVGLAMGLDDAGALRNFSHELTNKIIANYDPRNRPEIFQGALGAPIGLFQSYIFNFYSRMFRYMETKDARSFATQYAMQAGMFGMSGTPGWNALNWSFFDHQQAKGDADPVDSIYHRLGNADGDLVMNGVLSNIPKIFGAEGVNLYTRGDVSVRYPGTSWSTVPLGNQMALPVPNIPIVDTVTRIGKGLAAGFSALKNARDGVGLNQLAEIASNTIANRPIAGLIEQFGAHGADTSWDGQLVAQTHSMSEAIYRGLGVRSMVQQKQIDAFYASKTAMEEQGARRDSVTAATRAAIRDGRVDDVPKLFADYVQQGGDPRYYTRWLKQTVDSATNTRSERALKKALADPTNRSNALIERLLDGQVDIADGENSTDDYGRKEFIDQAIAEQSQLTPEPTTGSPMGGQMGAFDQQPISVDQPIQ